MDGSAGRVGSMAGKSVEGEGWLEGGSGGGLLGGGEGERIYAERRGERGGATEEVCMPHCELRL